jgi:hypothetical protein
MERECNFLNKKWASHVIRDGFREKPSGCQAFPYLQGKKTNLPLFIYLQEKKKKKKKKKN